MGKGIALDLALRGCHVMITDDDKEVLTHASRHIAELFHSLEELDYPFPEGVSDADPIERISIKDDCREAARADLVIEAISEDLEAKQRLYARLVPTLKPGAVLATNTSSLALEELRKGLRRPKILLGTHFFNPPPLMPLVETFAGEGGDPARLARVNDFLRSIGKEPVEVRRPLRGLIANRLQFALLREAIALVEAGVAGPEDVDRVVRFSFGRRLAALGPFANADLGGLHTYLRIFRYLLPAWGDGKEPELLTRLVANGHLGAASGRGFLNWRQKNLEDLTRRRDGILADLLRRDQERPMEKECS